MINNKVTAIIKAFERPQSLINLYHSIRKCYPELKIIIVDDSKDDMDTSIFDNNVEYIRTEFDIGLSAGRNLAVSKVKTPYFVLLDDDFLFSEKTKLEKMLEVLETTDFKIVSGGVCNYGTQFVDFKGLLRIKNGDLQLLNGNFKKHKSGYKVYDYVLNFFMAKTQTVIENKWDDSLKLGEHEDYFFRMKKNKVLITDVSDDIIIEHHPEKASGDKEYRAYRDRVFGYQKQAAEKNGYNSIIIRPHDYKTRSLKKVIKRVLPKSIVVLVKRLKNAKN